MIKEWKDVDWNFLTIKLKDGIAESKDGTIAVKTEEIARTIGKSDAHLGAIFWFSYVNLFEKGIMTKAILLRTGDIAMQFRLRQPSETWQSLYEFSLEIEKLKDLKIGLDVLLEQF